MQNISYDREQNARDCHSLYPINLDEVLACAKGPLGNQLFYAAGRLTHSLIPTVNYVPWLVADSVHTSDIQSEAEFELFKFVCNRYDVSDHFEIGIFNFELV